MKALIKRNKIKYGEEKKNSDSEKKSTYKDKIIKKKFFK
jgi:hypothetical protein